jgi:hypothetical protein
MRASNQRRDTKPSGLDRRMLLKTAAASAALVAPATAIDD